MTCQSLSIGYPVDLGVHELRTAESLVLVSFRLWALSHMRDFSYVPSWHAGLRAAGMEAAARQLFDPLLGVIFASSRRPIEVHRLGCYGISRDEGLFLTCIALYQHQQMERADSVLAEWLPPAAVRVAASLGMRFAAAMEVGRLLLPMRRADAVELGEYITTGAGFGRGLSLLH